MGKPHTQGFLYIVRCNGIIGVPITMLDKFNPEQFIIIGLAPERLCEQESTLQMKRYKNAMQHNRDGSTQPGNKVNDGPTLMFKTLNKILQYLSPKKPYYTAENCEGYLAVLYARILISKKESL